MSKIFARLMSVLPLMLAMLSLAAVLTVGIQFDHPPIETAKTYCFENGSAETGAVNLVSAIYLGYRAFDTLGETVVLIIAIAGTIFFLGDRHA